MRLVDFIYNAATGAKRMRAFLPLREHSFFSVLSCSQSIFLFNQTGSLLFLSLFKDHGISSQVLFDDKRLAEKTFTVYKP